MLKKIDFNGKMPSEVLRQIRDNEDVDADTFAGLTDVIARCEVMEFGLRSGISRSKRRVSVKKVDQSVDGSVEE